MSEPENRQTNGHRKNIKKQKNKTTMKIKKNPENSDQIDKSQELQQKSRKRKSSFPRKPVIKIKNNKVLSNNGIVLPCLADLEKMFEDSDNNTNQPTSICADVSSELQQSIIIDFTPQTSKDIGPLKNPIPGVHCSHNTDQNSSNAVKTKRPCHDSIVIDSDLESSGEDSGKNIPRKKQRLKDGEIISKSIENPFSDVVPVIPHVEVCNEAIDSDVTVGYHIDIPVTGRFSPLPSTSRDSDIILQNDLRFNASLTSNNTSTCTVDNSIPIETISIDEDDDCLVVDTDYLTRNPNIPPPIIIDDEYENGDLHEGATIKICDLSIDDIIAENTNILRKDKSGKPANSTVSPRQTAVNTNIFKKYKAAKPSTSTIFPRQTAENTNILNKYKSAKSSSTVSPRQTAENTNILKRYKSANLSTSTVPPPQTAVNTNILKKFQSANLCTSTVSPQQTAENTNILKKYKSPKPSTSTVSPPQTAENTNILKKYKSANPCTSNVSPRQTANTVEVNSSTYETSSGLALRNQTPVSNIPRPIENIREDNLRDRCNGNNPCQCKRIYFGLDHGESVRHIENGPYGLWSYNPRNSIKPDVGGQDRNSTTSTKSVPLINYTNAANVQKPKLIKNFGDCPICLEALTSKPIFSTVCGHLFCMKCLKTSLKNSTKCPTCRRSLKKNGYHQLFL